MAKGKRSKALKKAEKGKPQVVETTHTREVQQVVSQEYSGPLPHPSMLKEYEEAHPGFADRIITSWENETAHRHKLEEMAIKSEIDKERDVSSDVKRGQILAFLLSLGFLVVGGLLVYHDKQISGIIFGTSGFLGIVLAFLKTAFKSRDDNNQRNKNVNNELPSKQNNTPKE